MVNIVKKDKFSKPYEFFEVTADIGYWAYGNSLEESFENAALAMFNIMSNTDYVKPILKLNINISSEDHVSLLYDFLEELLYLHDVNLMLFSYFDISIEKDKSNDENLYNLTGIIGGELIDWTKHERGSEVKAVTFHMMEVLDEDFFKVRVILDL